MSFQQYFKVLRESKNLTQKEAAALIGISVETLVNYEKGLSFPNVPIIQRIENVYGLQYSDIIFLT